MAGIEDQCVSAGNGVEDGVRHRLGKPISVHYDELLEEQEDHPERVLIANPLRNRSREEVIRQACLFRRTHDLRDVVSKDLFVRAALAAQNPEAVRDIPGITKLELKALEREKTLSFWGQMKDLTRESIQILTTCCIAAIVQGWDQSSINGANLTWPRDLGLPVNLLDPNTHSRNVWIFGIVNASTYFSAALIGSQLSDPLNEYLFGRRGALFIAAAFSFAAVIACAYVNSWQALLGMRILLGIGIGAKASIVAIYIAETVPTKLRGSLTILWQMFVACGIFLGDAANLVVFNSWRKQVASPFIPAIPLMVLVWFCYESPRWLYKHNRVKSALNSLRHLRKSDILACRDLYLMHEQLQGEVKFFLRKGDEEIQRSVEPPTSAQAMAIASATAADSDEDDLDMSEEAPHPLQSGQETPTWGSRLRTLRGIYMQRRQKKPMEDYHLEIRNTTYFQRLRQLFVRPHVRATTAAACVMAAQQLCGINVFAFLSSTIFSDALARRGDATPAEVKSAQIKALWMSFGTGVSNFLFTFLAWGTIDRKGRRWLLNLSFPGMAVSLLGMALCFLIPEEHQTARLGSIVTFAILFELAYSPGVGPVPFTASAEMFPLFIREVGMSSAVFVNLLGAGIIALVTPFLAHALTHAGLLGLFVGLDLLGWLLCYLYYPETARISLEELRNVFNVPLAAQARYRILWLRCAVADHLPPLAHWLRTEGEEGYPLPMHVWWQEQPKTGEEKRAARARDKRERKQARERRKQEESEKRRQLREAAAASNEASRESNGRAWDVEERRRLQAELEQARREILELKRAREVSREADVEAVTP